MASIDQGRMLRPAAAPSRAAEYRALALMYTAQGLPTGLAFHALGTLMRQGGHGVAEVGLVGLAFLPWALKFLWAAPVDNACARWGHARVVGLTQALAVLACLALIALPPSQGLHATLAGVLALNTLAATQDIATNAYAVARLQGRAAGPANAIQVAGFIAGMLLGGGGLLMAVDRWGWQASMAGMAALMLALYLPLLVDPRWAAAARTPATLPDGGNRPQRARLRDLRRHPDLAWALALALVFKFASTAVETLAQPWLVDRGLSLSQIGALQTLKLLATAAGGVLLGIALVRRLGNRRAVAVGCALATALLGTTWAMEVLDVRALPLLYLAFGIESIAAGAMYVAIWALFMNWASPERPGTDYTAMQCCESLANALAAGAIGGLGASRGYGWAFAAAWAAGLGVLLLVCAALPRIRLQQEAPR
jgi:MFS transporter (putative signal transducer)